MCPEVDCEESVKEEEGYPHRGVRMGRKLQQDEAYEDWEAEAQARVDSPAMLEFERYRQRLISKPVKWYVKLFRSFKRVLGIG